MTIESVYCASVSLCACVRKKGSATLHYSVHVRSTKFVWKQQNTLWTANYGLWRYITPFHCFFKAFYHTFSFPSRNPSAPEFVSSAQSPAQRPLLWRILYPATFHIHVATSRPFSIMIFPLFNWWWTPWFISWGHGGCDFHDKLFWRKIIMFVTLGPIFYLWP